MLRAMIVCLLVALGICPVVLHAQDGGASSATDKALNFPASFFGRVRHATADLDGKLMQQTEKYVKKLAGREDRMREKLRKRLYRKDHVLHPVTAKDSATRRADSLAVERLFAGSQQRYASLLQKLKTDTGSKHMSISGEYQPYADSLRGALNFLQQRQQALGNVASQVPGAGTVNGAPGIPGVGAAPGNLGNLSPAAQAQLQGSIGQLQSLEAKLQDADQLKQFIRERKEAITQFITQQNGLGGSLAKDLQGMNQDAYYYSQQVREYKDMLNNPDAMMKKALSMLGQLPAFQDFMKNNSQLAGLFGLPGNYGTPAGLVGLQTRDQVNQLIQGQLAAGGPGAASALQSNLQSAESQLDGYKDKLNQLGAGSGDMDMPNFKPNDQKTKTFWKRLEYGANFQTTRNNTYYPTVADLGLSLGYKLGHGNIAGIGASYKAGLGRGWDHISFSSQGVGLRSFIDIKIKGSFFASGGYEYNYTTPPDSLGRQPRQLSNWTKSGLVGISKTISVKSRVFKKTKLSLLWDFLSYQQVPQTQPLLFRVGYSF